MRKTREQWKSTREQWQPIYIERYAAKRTATMQAGLEPCESCGSGITMPMENGIERPDLKSDGLCQSCTTSEAFSNLPGDPTSRRSFPTSQKD